MKKNTGNSMRLGIFITLGLALFIILIYYIGKKQQLFSTNFRISGIFKDISGLDIGNNVRFAGINIGVIENIEMLSDSAVRVDMVLGEKTRKFMRKGAKATIVSDGLMGGKIILIQPGIADTGVIQDHDMIASLAPVNIDDILGKVKTSLTNVTMISDDVAAILGNMRSGKGTMGKLFMDPTIANNLNQSIVNIKEGAGGFKQNMDAVGHNFLLRGYLKKKEKKKQKELEKQQKELEKKQLEKKKH